MNHTHEITALHSQIALSRDLQPLDDAHAEHAITKIPVENHSTGTCCLYRLLIFQRFPWHGHKPVGCLFICGILNKAISQ